MNPLVLESPYKAESGRTVSSRGHLLFEVTSKSRPPRTDKNGRQVGVIHTVDLMMANGEPIKDWAWCRCDCESWRLGGARPCCHGLDVCEALTANILKIAAPAKKEKPAPKPGRTYKLKR